MPVNILNLAGLNVVDFKETDSEYHVRATSKAVSRLCPHCGRSSNTVVHAKRTLVIRDIPSHGKAVVIHLDVLMPTEKYPKGVGGEMDLPRHANALVLALAPQINFAYKSD